MRVFQSSSFREDTSNVMIGSQDSRTFARTGLRVLNVVHVHRKSIVSDQMWPNRRILSPSGPLTAPPAACQVRLAELLTDVIATRGGTWEELWRVHDAALAELVLQVGVHCAERGELLQRIRRFAEQQA